MDFYPAIFRQIEDRVSVFFPDLGIPELKGQTWDEAYENAIAALAEWLAEKESNFVTDPSTYDEIRQKNHNEGEIVPVPVDQEIVKSIQKTKRFSVVFPVSVLDKVDKYRIKKRIRRSTLLMEAVLEYMKNHK